MRVFSIYHWLLKWAVLCGSLGQGVTLLLVITPRCEEVWMGDEWTEEGFQDFKRYHCSRFTLILPFWSALTPKCELLCRIWTILTIQDMLYWNNARFIEKKISLTQFQGVETESLSAFSTRFHIYLVSVCSIQPEQRTRTSLTNTKRSNDPHQRLNETSPHLPAFVFVDSPADWDGQRQHQGTEGVSERLHGPNRRQPDRRQRTREGRRASEKCEYHDVSLGTSLLTDFPMATVPGGATATVSTY